MVDFQDHGIILQPGASGEIRVLCPQCAGDHRNTDKTLGIDVERGLWHCFRCDWKGRLNSWVGTSVTPIYQKRIETNASRKKQAIQRVLSECLPLANMKAAPVMLYLKNRLGTVPDIYPRVGFHPSLPYFDNNTGKRLSSHPAMIGAIQSQAGETITLHRTYLTEAGAKANVDSPKKIMSPSVPGSITGGAIRLYEPSETLILAEGIETALALHIALKEPAWAAVSAHGINTMQLPNTVTSVIIGADNDVTRTGQKAAETLSKRLAREGRKVRVMIPEEPGKDWADVIQDGA